MPTLNALVAMMLLLVGSLIVPEETPLLLAVIPMFTAARFMMTLVAPDRSSVPNASPLLLAVPTLSVPAPVVPMVATLVIVRVPEPLTVVDDAPTANPPAASESDPIVFVVQAKRARAGFVERHAGCANPAEEVEHAAEPLPVKSVSFESVTGALTL